MRERGSVAKWAALCLGTVGCASGADNPFAATMVDSASFTSAGTGSATDSADTGSTSGDPSTSGPSGSGPTTDPTATSTTDPTATGTTDPTGETTGPGPPCTTDDECDDGSACTDDYCDPQNGCQNQPVDCDDADLCTDDTCDPVMGCLNDPVDCGDGVNCTNDSCDPQSGACVNAPDDGMCSDGDACNGTETCNAGSGCVAGTPVVCNDNDPCTQNICNSGTGQCSYPALQQCTNNDSCCPSGCSFSNDNDCSCDNFANAASTSSSGGGSNATGYGPNNLNDGTNEAQCLSMGCTQCFNWISNSTTSTGWFQLQWAGQQTIGSIYVEAENGTNPGCGTTGRNLANGNLQYWNGNNWVNAASFNNNNDDLSWDFNPAIVTDRIRLANVTSSPGNGNSMIFEWFVYESIGCFPP